MLPSRFALFAAFLTISVALAGCSKGDEGADLASVSAVTGAIVGLVVDDRFRPLQLMDAPRDEFQAMGFILVQETGQTVHSDSSGEFEIPALSPGSYTLRPSVEGHEGTPMAVRVEAGVFTEVTLVLRRTTSIGEDFALVFDTTVLMVCMSQIGNVYGNLGTLCFLDTSNEAQGSWVYINLQGIETVEAIVFEFAFSQVDDWSLSIHPSQGGVSAVKYAIFNVFDVDYTKHIMIPGETYNTGTLPAEPFDPYDMEVWIRRNHAGAQETYDLTGEAAGLGFTFQSKARAVISVFLTPPSDLEGYSLLA